MVRVRGIQINALKHIFMDIHLCIFNMEWMYLIWRFGFNNIQERNRFMFTTLYYNRYRYRIYGLSFLMDRTDKETYYIKKLKC